MGNAGHIDSLFVLMDDNTGLASGAFLEMFDDPNTFNINPSGTYSITVPEPTLATLLGVALVVGLALRRRR